MTSTTFRRVLGCALVLILGLAIAASAQNAPRQQPPEVKDLTAAFRLEDPAARLKELERIKAAFPASQYMAMIDQNILGAKIELALAKGKRGPDRRETLRDREEAREMERSFKGRFKL